MTEQEKIKYAYERMVKNNPDEAVKTLIKQEKEVIAYRSKIDKALEYIEEHKRNVYDTFGEGVVFGEMGGIKELLNILRGEDNEQIL